MKARNIKILSIFLVLLCCFMGAVSAADDVSTDAVDASVDDAVIADTVIDDTDDSTVVDETPVETVPDDSTIEEINEDIKSDEITEELGAEDSEPSRAMNTNAVNWSELKTACYSRSMQVIDLTGTEYTVGDQITFRNSATIRGTSTSYITGGTTSLTPFYNDKSGLTITFMNVKFKNMDVNNLLQLYGTNIFINCSFENITTANDHNSIIWNEQGSMEITGCNFTNNHVNFGAVTNYDDVSSDIPEMSVENCKFINNTATSEPGAINNCGNLDVTSSEFINNTASLWAGAIHTHYNSNTVIHNSNFTNNVALWNGGALYTYCNLSIYNSNFNSNWCNKSAGGGAIGCSNWVSSYNILVEDCTFEDNFNNNSLQNETPATGCGGAISAMNDGVLDVHGSTFINNYAAFGQAIAAYSQGYVNITAGIPNVIIYNNTFRNHNRTTETDTVEISGNYTLENNTFVNCHQENRNGSGNVYTNCTPRSQSEDDSIVFNENLKSKLGAASSDILGINPSDIFYVNVSSENDPYSGTGLSWENALGTDEGIGIAIVNINDGGTIYMADGNYYIDYELYYGEFEIEVVYEENNMTFIGQSFDTIFDNYHFATNSNTINQNNTYTFVNMSFINCDFTRHCKFINCNFISNITFTQHLSTRSPQTLERQGENCVRYFELENCIFRDFNLDSPFVQAYEYSNLLLKNCTFENIVADSIIYHNSTIQPEDIIQLYECKFTNCVVNGIIDFAGDYDIKEYCAIEDCTYDFDANTEIVSDDEHIHNYLNATKLAKPDTTLVADIDDAGNLLVNLTAGGNAVANGKVLISVNGAEAVSYDLGEDGTLSIALSDLTDATGKLDIAVTFEETDDYKGSTGSASAVLVVKTVTEKIDPVATSITASDITATAKIAKTLSITLKDANGNALANKAVKVTVNGKTSTVTTDKNGVAKVTVNYAKAGTYYYTFNYLGDNDYKASIKPVKVTVNKQATKATFAKKTFKVKATKKISFTLKDSKGKAIAKKKITFKVNGKTYTATTNSKGVATVKIVIKKKGKYTATAKFAGDTTYKAISKKATITIK